LIRLEYRTLVRRSAPESLTARASGLTCGFPAGQRHLRSETCACTSTCQRRADCTFPTSITCPRCCREAGERHGGATSMAGHDAAAGHGRRQRHHHAAGLRLLPVHRSHRGLSRRRGAHRAPSARRAPMPCDALRGGCMRVARYCVCTKICHRKPVPCTLARLAVAESPRAVCS